MELLLNPVTKGQIEAFCSKPNHGLLLSGPLGNGKYSVAQFVAANLLDLDVSRLAVYPYYTVIESSGQSISIEVVRKIKTFTQLKTSGPKAIRRVVVIQDADVLTTEAQNAFLKLLEEPPKDTVFILTSSQPRSLLDTISSRVQEIEMVAPAKASMLSHFAEYHDEAAVERAYHMSQGNIGLMSTLLKSDTEHPLAKSIETAKEVLKKPLYDRLLMINELSDSDIGLLLRGLYSIAHAALQTAVENQNKQATERWYHICQQIERAEEKVGYKPSIKLLLSDLFLNL